MSNMSFAPPSPAPSAAASNPCSNPTIAQLQFKQHNQFAPTKAVSCGHNVDLTAVFNGKISPIKGNNRSRPESKSSQGRLQPVEFTSPILIVKQPADLNGVKDIALILVAKIALSMSSTVPSRSPRQALTGLPQMISNLPRAIIRCHRTSSRYLIRQIMVEIRTVQGHDRLRMLPLHNLQLVLIPRIETDPGLHLEKPTTVNRLTNLIKGAAIVRVDKASVLSFQENQNSVRTKSASAAFQFGVR